MTKLTPEQVEKLEAAAEKAKRLQGSRMEAMSPGCDHPYTMEVPNDTILTLCREWRERGEALKKSLECPVNNCIPCGRAAEEALKGADDE